VRYRAENSLDGFSRAKTLLDIDREMASFRAITAGEEAASALVRSLQIREYPGAQYIDLKRHTHKAAVPFFLRAVQHQLAKDRDVKITVTLEADPPKLTVALPIKELVTLPAEMADLHLQFSDPLGMVGTQAGIDASNFFDAAVRKVAGSRKVDKLIASEANSRNQILYAHDSGLPVSQVTLQSIESRERSACLCIILAVAVLQVNHHQEFALQCLKGFLKVIGRTEPA
jgi:ubiquitin